jgi:hypothetical protein
MGIKSRPLLYLRAVSMPRIKESEFGLLPTVSTTDWNTPYTKIQKEKKMNRRQKEGKTAYPSALNQLRQMAFDQLLPTPTLQDYTNSTFPPSQLHRQHVVGYLMREGILAGSRLNPQFVAEMMGFPTNWTELPFQSGEMKV